MVNSDAITDKETSPQIKTKISKEIIDLYEYEKTKYKSKGYGMVIAYLIVFLFFTYMVKLCNQIYSANYSYLSSGLSDGKFYSLSVIVVHSTTFVISNIAFLFIYHYEIPFFEKYRVDNHPRPWEDPNVNWPVLRRNSILLNLTNHFIVIPLSLIHYYLDLQGTMRLDPSPESLPTCFEVFWQICFFILCDDFVFYWVHRLAHVDWIYPWSHKWHHTFRTTITIAAEHSHPLDYFFSSVLATSSGSLILGQKTHLVTYMMWIVFRMCETVDGHCGYEFSFSPYRILPMGGSSEYHYFHHRLFKGNYSSLLICWDWICGTISPGYVKFYNMKHDKIEKEEKEKRQ